MVDPNLVVPPIVGTIWTSDDVVALKKSLAGGVLTVIYAGPPQRQVTYQSLAEMRSLLASMIQNVYPVRRWRRVRIRKGFRDGDTDTE